VVDRGRGLDCRTPLIAGFIRWEALVQRRSGAGGGLLLSDREEEKREDVLGGPLAN